MKRQRCLLCGEEATTGIHLIGCLLCFRCEQRLLYTRATRDAG